MELGNMCFGNSRGEFELPRGEGFEEEVERLFVALCGENFDYHGSEFENDVFWIFPYWWGECTCGWDDASVGLEMLKHRDCCYQTEYQDRRKEFDKDKNKLKDLYERHGFHVALDECWWHGCAIRCSCDLPHREEALYNECVLKFGHPGHKPDCKLLRDNFHFKPTGLGLQWYKYPLRDSYTNREVTLSEFRSIVDKCIESLGDKNKAREEI